MDAHKVVRASGAGEEDCFEFSFITTNCRDLLANRLDISISWAHTNSNVHAHRLAREAHSHLEFHIWEAFALERTVMDF